MLPYHDENDTRRPAYVTYALIAVNVLTWLIVQGAGLALPLARSVCNLGLIPGELTGGVRPGVGFLDGRRPDLRHRSRPTNQQRHHLDVLHGSWMHLLGNMWFLWLFGNNVEDSMSRPRFMMFYVVCGLAAALLQVVVDPNRRARWSARPARSAA